MPIETVSIAESSAIRGQEPPRFRHRSVPSGAVPDDSLVERHVQTIAAVLDGLPAALQALTHCRGLSGHTILANQVTDGELPPPAAPAATVLCGRARAAVVHCVPDGGGHAVGILLAANGSHRGLAAQTHASRRIGA